MTPTMIKVNEYKGTNPFILKMKDVIEKWGKLTPKQEEAVERVLSVKPTVNIDELPENLQKIAKYDGPNNFVQDIQKKLLANWTLSELQISKANEQIVKERTEMSYLVFPKSIPTPGETIKIGRGIGIKLKETYGLKFNPILIDITKIIAITEKAVKFSGKLTIKRGDVCTSCLRTLTDEFSMLTGMGKTCAKHLGVPYITDRSQATKFREEYLKRVDEIGEMEFWIPKTKIVKWEGKTQVILQCV